MPRLTAAAVLAVVVSVWLLAPRQPEPRAWIGGPILTMDAEDRIAGGIGIEGDRIALVGDEAAVRAWAEDVGAPVADLAGRALLPGFIDAHGHFPGEGIFAVHVDLNSPPIGEVETIDDLVVRLAARAQETPEGEWIVGMGYDDTLLAEGRHPTRTDLDRVSTAHPIALWHVSGHLATSNSLALEAFGYDRDTPDPEGGLIRRDASGEPDGVLEETAMDPVNALIAPGLLDGLEVVREASRRYVRNGVTTAQSGATDRGLFAPLQWSSRLGLIPLRLVIWPLEDTARALADGSFSFEGDGAWVRRGAVKLIADGSIQGYTGYLSAPYHVPPGEDATYRGYPRIPREELIETVVRLHRQGFQIAVHGNGDAAIDDILDAFEAAQRAEPHPDPRFILIHAQMARDDQLDRMRALSVVPSFFSLHTFYWGDRHREIFMGPERAARMSPAASARAKGVRFTIHCDSPVVPMEPLRLVWAAVNRRTRSGVVVGAAERITPLEALRAVTADAAYQHFEEDSKGTLEAGKLADLVILSRSPLEDPERIDEIEVVETVVGGRSVYVAD